MRFDSSFLRRAVPGITIYYDTLPAFPSVSVDSRAVTPADIFFAIAGQQQDGHLFVVDALGKGAAGIVIQESEKQILETLDQKLLAKVFVATVPNTLDALLQLATAWRAQFNGAVVGVTGSIGKTSTKQLLSHILEAEGRSHYASVGTQNTFIGIALNLLQLRPEHKVGIFEMGINKRGQMAKKAAMVRPTTAIITSVGHSHMEGLGSILDVAAEKRDIFSYFKEDSIGIVHGDNPLLASVSYPHPVIKFGQKTTNQVQARKIRVQSDSQQFVLKLYGQKWQVTLPNNHAGYLSNCLAAVATAYHLGVLSDIIVRAIMLPLKVPGRFEQRKLKSGRGILINDAYNASPESMKAALIAFQNLQVKGAKIAVLGDMLELGVNSPFWHRQLGRLLRKAPSLQEVVFVGDLVKWAYKTVPVNININHVPTWHDAVHLLQEKIARNELIDESAILIKGSRDVGLMHLADELT